MPATLTQHPELKLEGASRPRPSVCVILPAFNEEAIIERNVREICAYLKTIGDRYDWRILIVNDGSADRTGQLADQMATENFRITVVHHEVNMGLCQAMKVIEKRRC